MNQPDDINPDTRFVFLCDEWASLPAMSCMTQLLFEGRSKNVMMGLLFQNVSQAITTYGESTARAIIDSASCYVIFRANDVQTAEFWSRALGSAEVDFTETSLSAGERQGSESYRYVRQMDLAVMASEIQRLADLECFISMANQPVTRGKLEYQDYPKVQPAFVPAENDGPRVGSRDAAQKSDQPDSQSNRHENPSQTGMEKDFDIEKFDF
jgi:type IV secretory pathway TraG/TraD family ATPase VirD4